MEENHRRGSFSAFCARRGELLPNPAALASGNQLLSQARHTQTHTCTHLHTMCKPDQSLTASTDPHYSLKYVSGPPCLVSFSHFSPFLFIFRFFPHFLPSHPLYPLSPDLYFVLSPFSPSFSSVSLSLSPCEICPAGFSFFLLSTQLTNPRERKRSSWFYTARGRDGWMGGGQGGRWGKRYRE